VAAALGTLLVACVFFPPSRAVTLHGAGRDVTVPLPFWGIRLSSGSRSARFLALGDPDLGRRLGELVETDQMGSNHVFEADGVRLDIITSKRTRWLTQLDLELSP
jgi:hypothetical protein